MTRQPRKRDRSVLAEFLRDAEQAFLAEEFVKSGRNVSKLAQQLGVQRSNLSRKLKSHGIT